MAGVTRFLAAAATLGVVGVLAAAAHAARAPGSPKLAIQPAQQARAQKILLKQAELPGTGWMRKPADFGAVNPDCVVKHYSLARLTANAEVGAQFTRAVDTGTFLVESEVHIFATAGQAGAAGARLSDLGYAHCLGATLASEAPPGSSAKSREQRFSITGLAVPAEGFRITVGVATAAGQKQTLSAYVLGFRRGRTVTSLSVLTLGKGWSAASLRSVSGKLAARTAAF